MLLFRSLLSNRVTGSFLLSLFAFSKLSAQSATAPTASLDPESIDQIWQKASSKYGGERTAQRDIVNGHD